MIQVYNFSVGFVMLLVEVLCCVEQELCNWYGLGMLVMEISYCSKEFMQVVEEVEKDLCDLMQILVNYKVLFCYGGVCVQFVVVLLNLLGDSCSVDYIDGGYWVYSVVKEV